MSPTAPPDWRDGLWLRIAIDDPAIQEHRGYVVWNTGARLGRLPFSVISDGRPRDIIIPLGINSDWTGNVTNIHLVFLDLDAPHVVVTHAGLFKRSPFALDAAIGRAVMPVLPDPPGWSALAWVTAALLMIGAVLSLSAHFFKWRICKRQLIPPLLLGLGLVSGTVTALNMAQLLPALWLRYAGLSDRDADLAVPHYNDSPSSIILLGEAAQVLPGGPVLIHSPTPMNTTFKARAEYMLFPRTVEFTVTRIPPPAIGFSSLILMNGALIPEAKWERAGAPATGSAPAIYSTNMVSTARVQAKYDTQVVVLWVLALSVVIFAGFGLAQVLGWSGIQAMACSLPFGTGILAWWMSLLSLLNVPWSTANIGVAVGLLGVGFVALRHKWVMTHGSPTPPLAVETALPIYRRATFSMNKLATITALIVVIMLTIAVMVQAGLVPFSDQDSWSTWALSGRAFYTTGGLADAIRVYGNADLSHPSYPPAFPLLQTWGYIATNEAGERLIKLSMPLWYVSLLGLVWSECRRHLGATHAAGWTLLVATTPLVLDHAALGNADLPFTVVLFVAGICLLRWLNSSSVQPLIGMIMTLGIAAWIKVDGIYLGVGLIIAAGIVRLVLIKSIKRRITVIQIVGSLIGIIVIYAPWLLFLSALGVHSESPTTGGLAVSGMSNLGYGLKIMVDELLFSTNNSAWGLLGGGYGLLWIVGVAGIVVNLRRRDANVLFLFVALLGVIMFYLLIYALRPYYSIERYLMHATPFLILAASAKPPGYYKE